MTDGGASPHPWHRLPPSLAPALRERAPAIIDAIVAEVAGTAYAGIDDAKTLQDIRRGVTVAVERCIDLVATTEPALAAGVRETFVDLGAAEAREDRAAATLVGAVRNAARVLLRQASAALASVQRLTTDDVIDLADAITAFVDELVTAATNGYSLQLREQAGERDRRRRLLAEMLVRGSAAERAVLTAAEAIGWPRLEDVVPILLPHEHMRQAQFRFRDDAVTLDREQDAVLLLRRGRSATRTQLERTLPGRGAVVGVTVDWARAPQAVRLAELTARIAGPDPDGDPVFVEDHLATLALRGEQVAFTILAERRLAPFAALPDGTRDRLLETLHSWLRHWGSRAAVAEELDVHPQTVSYRIRQLRELLGDQIDDADARFELGLVLADRAGQ